MNILEIIGLFIILVVVVCIINLVMIRVCDWDTYSASILSQLIIIVLLTLCIAIFYSNSEKYGFTKIQVEQEVQG